MNIYGKMCVVLSNLIKKKKKKEMIDEKNICKKSKKNGKSTSFYHLSKSKEIKHL